MTRFTRASVFAGAALLALLAGCSSSRTRFNLYERPSSFGVAATGTRPSLVVNPVVFEGIPNPEPWQKEIGAKLQQEFVNSTLRTGVLTPVVAEAPVRGGDDGYVLDVTMRDSSVEYPVWYVFVAGEKQTYTLNGDVRISRKGETVASFKFSQSKTGYERMFGSYFYIPLFPFGSAKKDAVVNDLMAKFYSEFEMFLVRSQDVLARGAPKPDTAAAPRIKPVQQIAASADWQANRPERVGKFRISPIVGFGVDVSEKTGLERYKDVSTTVAGPALGFEVSMRPLVSANGIETGSPTVYPELWARFLHLKTTISVYLDKDDDDDDDFDDDDSRSNSKELISEDEGGETHMSILAGGRVVFRPMEMWQMYLQLGAGATWGSQEGDVVPKDPEEFPDVEYIIRRTEGDTKTALQALFGGGVRLGHSRDLVNYDIGFNILSSQDRDETILLPNFALHFRL